MKHASIFEVMRRLRRFPLRLQHAHLSALNAGEPPHSIRRHELEAAMRQIVMRDLKASNRAARKAS